MTAERTLRVGIAGIHGHGAGHVTTALELERSGRMRLVAVADPRPPDATLDGVAAYTDTERMLRDEDLDVVVLSTPMHTHLPLAHAALHAGAHVLLEKPPTPTLADFERLVAASEGTGRAVQIGFQSLGSSAVGAVRELIAAGAIGEVSGYGALGTWPRTEQYWRRAPWAGRRTLDGVPVVDGAVTNPLAHAMATALAVAGATTTSDVSDVRLDLHRANDIEADDTSSLVVSLADGASVAAALSLTAAERAEPCVIVRGSEGRIVLWYTLDLVQVLPLGAQLPTTTSHARTGLLANLVDHVRDGAPLLVPAASTGAFMRVLEAVRTGEPASPIDPRFIDRVSDADGDRRVVRDLESWSERVVLEGRTFRELGAPWAGDAPA
ncbi:putative dehydrogenase [Agromyces terreus]|uniref:Dehydrogenase n=1 Tax=Agromyces terreus TaxID=424795 RepID=A0A9X2GYK4_9MICO|nr:Gfo/Idh/MocA family oxidoreductase [Agromyces terreus]MCP2369816.1 putative dehydrogenase [Agromyces terreus]